jgi:hypothetical protein
VPAKVEEFVARHKLESMGIKIGVDLAAAQAQERLGGRYVRRRITRTSGGTLECVSPASFRFLTTLLS